MYYLPQQEGDKLTETLLNKQEGKLADLEASQSPHNDKIEYISAEDQIKGIAKEAWPPNKAVAVAIKSFVKTSERWKQVP